MNYFKSPTNGTSIKRKQYKTTIAEIFPSLNSSECQKHVVCFHDCRTSLKELAFLYLVASAGESVSFQVNKKVWFSFPQVTP